MQDVMAGSSRLKGGKTMAMYILLFAVVTFFVSFLIGRSNDLDRGKMATFVTLIAWGSLLFGLYMARAL
jgi:hypothetical protein